MVRWRSRWAACACAATGVLLLHLASVAVAESQGVPVPPGSPPVQADLEVLQALNSSLQGGTGMPSWQAEAPCSAWLGVVCSPETGRVIALRLSQQGLLALPSSLGMSHPRHSFSPDTLHCQQADTTPAVCRRDGSTAATGRITQSWFDV
jgi:hypothetical protein